MIGVIDITTTALTGVVVVDAVADGVGVAEAAAQVVLAEAVAPAGLAEAKYI
jgi:hypothetical protein